MGCCNDKNKHHHHNHHHHCHGLPDKFVDVSCMKTKEWEEVPTIIGLTECGHVVPVDKPLHELTQDDRDKLDSLIIDAEGTSALYDDGTYKETYTKEQTEEAIITATEDAVFYDSENNINPRANILLSNGEQLLGKSNTGGRHNIAQVTTSNVVNVGDPSLDYHINSLSRPKVNAFTTEGYVVNEVAYKAEIDDLKEKTDGTNTDLSALEDRVSVNENDIAVNAENIAANAQNIAQNSDHIAAIRTNIAEIEEDVEALDTRLTTAEENIQTNTTTIADLDAATEAAFDKVGQSLEELDGRVSENTANIAVNTSDIETLRDDLASRELFRGYYETIAQVTTIKKPVDGNYAWCAETGTVWIYNGATWFDSTTPIPDQTVQAYEAVPRMDGEGDAGVTNRYARGDHQHPSDESKANLTDLDNYLALAGNTQSTRMSGDIWMSTGKHIKLSNSGKSYLTQEADDNTIQLFANGVGGVDMITPNGTVKANGDRVVTEKEHNHALLDITELQSDVAEIEADIVALDDRLATAEENIEANAAAIVELDTATEATFEAVNQSISELDGRVTENAANIAVNTSDIEILRDDLASRELFRGYYETIAEVTIIENPVAGNYAWCAESGTVWMYNGTTWFDSTTPVPDQTVDAYDATPRMDGAGDAGATNRYARGDHQHPSDDSKANLTDLTNYLALSGNTQNTRISGDIWMSTGQALKLTNSGNSYLAQDAESSTTQLVANGVGGVDLVAPNGIVKANGDRVITETEYNEALADISELQSDIAENESDISGLNGRLTTAEENIEANAAAITDLDEATGTAFVAVGQSINDLDGRVTKNSADIASNKTDIDTLRDDLAGRELFRGYYETIAEVTAIENPVAGNYAWCAQSGTVWVYNSETWMDSEVPVPDQTVEAYDATPRMDGAGDAGATNRYARGDHQHPSDESKANLSELDNYLKLEGNSQATRMSGDIWMETGQQIKLTNSGNSYLGQDSEDNVTNLVGNGAGGINIQAPNGSVKVNGDRVVTASEYNGSLADITALQADVENNASLISELRSDVDINILSLSELQTATETTFDAINGSLSDHDGRISRNAADIAGNKTDIESLRDDLAGRELFRGYYETIAEVTAIEKPVAGNYAWCAQSGTVWVYNSETWMDSEVPVPDQTVEAYDATPRMDGAGDAGATNRYARGDHQHPSDESKANVTDLDSYLALGGNSQTTRMSGDIWMETGQKVRLSNSGNAYIGQGSDNNTEIVNSGVGGINLNTPNSTANYNGAEIATVDDIATLSGDASVIADNLAALSGTVNSIDGRVAQNEADITDLQQALESTEHFRGYFATTAEITSLAGGSGDFAWNGSTGTVWVYNTSIPSWVDSEELIPAETPYDALPQMDGTANAGNVTAYSRGNHVHPTDTSRASVEALTALESTVSSQGEQLSAAGESISALQSAVSEQATDMAVVQTKVENQNDRISAAEGNITTLKSDVSTNASDIAVVQTKVSNQGEQISSAQENIASLQSDVSANASDIAVVQNRVTSQGERISTAEGNITALKTDVSSNAGDIAVLQSTVSDQGGRLTTAEGQIVTINSNLSAAQSTLTNYVASNDPRVSTLETKVYDLQGRTSASESAVSTLQGNVVTNSADIQELVGNVSANTTAIKTLRSTVGTATEDLSALDGRVSVNESNIALNASDIKGILDRLAAQEKFRGYYQTIDEVTAIANPENGDYAWNGETNTVWIYNGTTWANSGILLPDVIVKASDAAPLIDGEAEAGESNEYSRGDHRHPTDVSRASAADLTALENTVSGISDKVEDLRTDVDENTSGVAANASAINTLQSNLSTAQGDITDLQGDVTTNAANIEATTNRVTTAEGKISAIQDTLETVQGDVATNKGDIATLKTNYNELEENLATVEESLQDYLPLAGGRMNGSIYLNNKPLIIGTNASNYIMGTGKAIEIKCVAEEGIDMISTIGDIDLTTSDGIATYNGEEIATKADIENLGIEDYLPLAGGKMSGSLIMDTNPLILSGSPTGSVKIQYSTDTTATGDPGLRISGADVDAKSIASVNISTYQTGDINLNPASSGKAYYNRKEIATKEDIENLGIENYLPLEGGTVTGDLTVEGQLFNEGVVLTSDGNIDSIVTPGNYHWGGSTIPQGTYPDNFNHDLVATMNVYRTVSSSCFQVIYSGDNIYYRRGTISSWGNWAIVAKRAELASYLPLSGGQLTGDLGIGTTNALKFGDDINTGSSQLRYRAGIGVQLLGSSSGVELDNDITIKTQSAQGHINLNTQQGGIATYNGDEIATVSDIPKVPAHLNALVPANTRLNDDQIYRLATSTELYGTFSALITAGINNTVRRTIELSAFDDEFGTPNRILAREVFNPGSSTNDITNVTFWYRYNDAGRLELFIKNESVTNNIEAGVNVLQYQAFIPEGFVKEPTSLTTDDLTNIPIQYIEYLSKTRGGDITGTTTYKGGEIANKEDLDAYLPLSGGTMADNIFMNFNKIGFGATAAAYVGQETTSGGALVLQSSLAEGVKINSGSVANAPVTLEASTGGNINLNTTSNGIATYNGNEIATTTDLESYLPLTGGSISGSLDISGGLTYGGTELTSADDIDNIFVSGNYYFNVGTTVGGTFPTEHYTTTTRTALLVIKLSGNAVYQVMFNNGYGWFRRLDSSTVYSWSRIATGAQLENYLPLAGGTMSGILNMDSNPIYLNNTGGSNLQFSDDTVCINSLGQNGITIGANNVDNNAHIALNTSGANANIALNTVKQGKALYNGNEIATTADLSSYLPLTGGAITGPLYMNGQALYLASSTTGNRITSSNNEMVIASNQTGGTIIRATANNTNISLETNGSGKALYNGNEIATTDQLPSVNTGKSTSQGSATITNIPSGASIVSVNYNRLLLFESDYSYSGTTVTITNTDITGSIEATDKMEVTYLIVS